jgi:predicted outer membrane lipoprotein
MKDVHITTNSWVPVGLAVSVCAFVVASAMWAATIEAKADKALEYQIKYESLIERRLDRIEKKIDKALER